MIKKKQFLTVLSIAVIAFLFGTTFNMNFIAAGGDSNPWSRVWEAISKLQNQVSVVDQVKTIRFYEPSERMTTQSQYVDVVTFIWTPSNNTNNAILRIACYFLYRTEPGNEMLFRIVVNDEVFGIQGWLESPTYRQSIIYSDMYLIAGLKMFPNQNNYTIKFQLTSFYSEAYVYAKNINIILEVVDGLPASN